MSAPYSLQEGVVQALKANTTLIAFIDTNLSSVYAPDSFDSATTWIVMTQVSGQRHGDHDGVAADMLSRPRFQFTIGGKDKEVIDQVRRILVNQFDGLTFQDGTQAAGAQTLDFEYADDREHWDPSTKIYECSVDLYVWCNT